MKKMKVFIDAQMLSRSNQTGMGRYITELLPELELSKDFEWIVKKPKPIKFYRTIWEHTVLPLEVLYLNADILFCPSNIAPIFLPKKIKLVITIHDVRFKVFPETFSKATISYYNFIYRVVTKRANAVITVSEFSKAEILKYFPELENKIYVIYNGVNHNKFRPLNLPRKKQILFIGAIAKHKNISVILEAFQKVINKIPHKIVIAGSKDSGMPSDENINKILSTIPPDRIEFTGKISDEDLIRLYNTSDFFIFPSIYEGFGLPLLEAMACGCPIIASKASSIPEVCGDSAIYFDPYSSEELSTRILEMANNEALKNELAQKGIRRAKEFSWRKASDMHIEVFKKVLYENPNTKS